AVAARASRTVSTASARTAPSRSAASSRAEAGAPPGVPSLSRGGAIAHLPEPSRPPGGDPVVVGTGRPSVDRLIHPYCQDRVNVDSFEDLGTPPELVDALAAEGIESPTPLQESAVPLLRKGNNVVLAAGPGSGLMAAWALPLLDRYPPEGMHAHILVLAGDRVASQRLAESMARLAQHT